MHVHSAANSVSCLRLCGKPHGEVTQRTELLPWQKYCNRNHFTGWGGKSLFSSSHFRSGQSLTHPGHLGVSFPQSQGIFGRVPGESRRNRGSLLLQGPRKWLSGSTERPLKHSSGKHGLTISWRFSSSHFNHEKIIALEMECLKL